MKKRILTVLCVIMLVTGFAIRVYPDIRTWQNANVNADFLEQQEISTAALYEDVIADILRRAEEVNEALRQLPEDARFNIAHEAEVPSDYMYILNVGGTMARLEIPRISLDLPIFHSTRSDVLDVGIGHIEGTSFPIGGESTHAAFTAHTALPTARLFCDLEGNVQYGDLFFITVLGTRMAYEVDQILVVLPHEIESLRIQPGEDLVTLITCTPPTVNTHRLLVRGRRVPYVSAYVEAE